MGNLMSDHGHNQAPDSRILHRHPSTANLRTKIMHFRGFDSSRTLILRGVILMSIGNCLESLTRPPEGDQKRGILHKATFKPLSRQLTVTIFPDPPLRIPLWGDGEFLLRELGVTIRSRSSYRCLQTKRPSEKVESYRHLRPRSAKVQS